VQQHGAVQMLTWLADATADSQQRQLLEILDDRVASPQSEVTRASDLPALLPACQPGSQHSLRNMRIASACPVVLKSRAINDVFAIPEVAR
jgi:hypothetical protein